MLNLAAPPTGLPLTVDGPLRLGITGGIGSGKSTVAKVFGVLGAPLYFADARAKALMEEVSDLREGILHLFGKDSYDAAGRLNRPHLSALAFGQPELQKQLNALVHPAVVADYEAWASKRRDGVAYTIKESALLFEAETYKRVHYVLHVSAPVELRVSRTLERDPQRSREQVENIIRLQLAETEREARSHIILRNGEADGVLAQVLDIHTWLLAKSALRN